MTNTDEIKLTEKETEMLKAFIGAGIYTNGADCADDLINDNMTWMSSADLVDTLGWSQRSVQGVMASLEKKDMISNSGESARGAKDPDWTATDEGILRIWDEIDFQDFRLVDRSEAPEVDEVTTGGAKPAKAPSLCQTLRAAALKWQGTRAEFVAEWVAQGVHKGTAGTQWAKAHREGK